MLVWTQHWYDGSMKFTSITPQDFGVSPCTVCAWESSLTVVTQSPCDTAKSNFNASYSGGKPAHFALASNSVCSEGMVKKNSLTLPIREKAESPPLLAQLFGSQRSWRVLRRWGTWFRCQGRLADSSHEDPRRCFPSTGRAVVLD